MERLCRLFGVARSGYYAWRDRKPSRHKQDDERLKQKIQAMHVGHFRSYGAPRVHRHLREAGVVCSRRRIGRLMRELGIRASTCGLYKWNPGGHAFYSCTGNVLAVAGKPEGPGQQWAGDFTYVRTGAGWLYCAVIIDLYHRKVVGWSFGRQRNADLTISALRMALNRERIHPGCLFHSDQGIEYAANAYRDAVHSAGMVRSMSRKGNPLDNATVESFFHTLKSELIHQHRYKDEVEAVANIVHYIEFYNRDRLHSSLGYKSPVQYLKCCA